MPCIKSICTVTLASLACLAASTAALAQEVTQKAAETDPVLEALKLEADRAAAALRTSADAPLYYLAYRVRDGSNVNLAASFGAMLSLDSDDDPLSGRSRHLDVSARVGSPKLDSTHKIRGNDFEMFRGRGGGDSAQLPIDDDLAALRLAVWRTTDRAYERAVKRLLRVRGNKAVKVAEEDDADDFDQEPPQVHLGASVPWKLDRPAWEARLRKLSALFRDHPLILRSQVALTGGAWTSYFVDTEGARIRQSQSSIRLMVSATAKAADGMELDLYRDFEAITPDQLPTDEQIAAAIAEMTKTLEALRTAPVAEPYSGPAIVTNRAAGVFFHEIFGHRVEGHRQKDADEGHTFTRKVNQPVLPAFLSVTDDPTREKFGNIWLNGHYLYDDEGVPAQQAKLVENGVLKGFLMGRSPIHGFQKSNGHGRAQPGSSTVARQGNLIVSSTRQVSFADLRRQLVEEVKRQKKPYGLVFEDIAGGFTQTQAYALPQAFKVLPLVVKRVYPDGRPDELVRGVDLIGTPLASFEKIIATGSDFDVFNGVCGAESGWVPVAAVAPSLLLENIEVDRHEPNHDRLPVLPPPLHPDLKWDDKGPATTTLQKPEAR